MLRWLYSLWLHVPALKVMGHDRRNRPCHTRTQPRNTRSIVKWYILSSLRRGFEGLRALLPPPMSYRVFTPRDERTSEWPPACGHTPALPRPSRAQSSHAPARLVGVFREIMHGRSLVPQPGLTQPGPAACLTPPVSKHAVRLEPRQPAFSGASMHVRRSGSGTAWRLGLGLPAWSNDPISPQFWPCLLADVVVSLAIRSGGGGS